MKQLDLPAGHSRAAPRDGEAQSSCISSAHQSFETAGTLQPCYIASKYEKDFRRDMQRVLYYKPIPFLRCSKYSEGIYLRKVDASNMNHEGHKNMKLITSPNE